MTIRRWYQFRLSTALLLMFAASLLLWLNVRQTEDRTTKNNLLLNARGWPYAWHVHIPQQEVHFKQAVGTVRESSTIQWTHLALNTAIALGILGATAFLTEWTIRRREKSA